jgi:hypothetical protein
LAKPEASAKEGGNEAHLSSPLRGEKKMAYPRGSLYCQPMTADDVKTLPIDQKIQIMEAIWEDFRRRRDRLDVPQRQKELLDVRRVRVRESRAELLDWESVKGSIGRP